jgi:hypothetical protein
MTRYLWHLLALDNVWMACYEVLHVASVHVDENESQRLIERQRMTES